MPGELFYNTGISIYVWVLSKNKAPKRRGKVQLIDATAEWTPMRRSLGNKRKQISPEQIDEIVGIYTSFEEGEHCHILPNEEFLYKEYTVKQPLQRSYQITPERIDTLAEGKFKEDFHNPAKMEELSLIDEEDMTSKQKRDLAVLQKAEPTFGQMIQLLRNNLMDTPTQDYKGFEKDIKDLLSTLPSLDRKSVV